MSYVIEWETTADFYHRKLPIYNEDLPCTFKIFVETYEDEPYSWGQSRGDVTEVMAKLLSVQFGEATFDRHTVVKMYGVESVKSVEEDAAERYGEQELEL